MLHCTMTPSSPSPGPPPAQLRLELDDVLGNLHYARRSDDLGRLALLTYWEVRRLARWAHRDALASLAFELITAQPHPSRSAFLAKVDQVIQELESIRADLH
jgi:hypothetical protein